MYKIELSQQLSLLSIVVQAMMTKMQHPHNSVGKKENVLRLPYFYLLE
jgi:hypothetical protein